jgi:hypothetical protein
MFRKFSKKQQWVISLFLVTFLFVLIFEWLPLFYVSFTIVFIGGLIFNRPSKKELFLDTVGYLTLLGLVFSLNKYFI